MASHAVLNLYKQLGETSYGRLERLRKEQPKYQHEVLSFAGRLDPMAEGVLLCLVGPENKNREQYLRLSKEYVLDIVFGFSTDTYDVLGKILATGSPGRLTRAQVADALREYQGKISQQYPPYSSKTIEGKPLFIWARAGGLGSLVMPEKSVEVYELAVENWYKVKEPQLRAYSETNIKKVVGDFRQDDIAYQWQRELRPDGVREFPAVSVRISCSSGTYMRSIADGVGKALGVPALSLHILRTKVGDFHADKALA